MDSDLLYTGDILGKFNCIMIEVRRFITLFNMPHVCVCTQSERRLQYTFAWVISWFVSFELW